MSEQVLLIEKTDGIATLTLNRPQAMNALSRALRAEIVRAFAALRGDASVGVVILTGAGRAFCAGLDLKELGGERGASEETESVLAGGDVVAAVSGCAQPVIGAINGFAITGGFELALACDVLVASSAARFADTHARVGIMPGWGLNVALWIHRIEAILAMCHVFIIHFFIGHLRRQNFPMDRAMFEGSADLEATRHERPAWVTRLHQAGALESLLVPEVTGSLRAVYYLLGYLFLAIGFFLLIGGLVNSPYITW